MDYKYINQLLDRYWECQTTLEEEVILRSFFSQEDIPASLLPYRNLFIYELTETKKDVLDDDFDAKVLTLIGQKEPVKARVISMTQRIRPLFKAVAIVAVILTLANAMQVPFSNSSEYDNTVGVVQKNAQGPSVANVDTAIVDSMHRSSLTKHEMANPEQIDNIQNQAFKLK